MFILEIILLRTLIFENKKTKHNNFSVKKRKKINLENEKAKRLSICSRNFSKKRVTKEKRNKIVFEVKTCGQQ